MSNIIIADIKVRQDKEGRFSLNDLHKSAGGERRHEPNFWLNNKQTIDLIEELKYRNSCILAIEKKKGRLGGTYVCKELVYAYAMWISPKFHLEVIRVYDQLVTQNLETEKKKLARQALRLESRQLTDAVKTNAEEQNLEIDYRIYASEFNMLYMIAFGMTAEQLREYKGIGKDDNLRDGLTKTELEVILALQRYDETFNMQGMGRRERKNKLTEIFNKRHKEKLIDSLIKLES